MNKETIEAKIRKILDSCKTEDHMRIAFNCISVAGTVSKDLDFHIKLSALWHQKYSELYKDKPEGWYLYKTNN